jgi:hypothetical protein
MAVAVTAMLPKRSETAPKQPPPFQRLKTVFDALRNSRETVASATDCNSLKTAMKQPKTTAEQHTETVKQSPIGEAKLFRPRAHPLSTRSAPSALRLRLRAALCVAGYPDDRVCTRGVNQVFSTRSTSLRTCEQGCDGVGIDLLSGTSALIFRNCGQHDHASIRRGSVSRVKINIGYPVCFPPSNDLQASRFNRLILLRYSHDKPLSDDHRVTSRARLNANGWRNPWNGSIEKDPAGGGGAPEISTLAISRHLPSNTRRRRSEKLGRLCFRNPRCRRHHR